MTHRAENRDKSIEKYKFLHFFTVFYGVFLLKLLSQLLGQKPGQKPFDRTFVTRTKGPNLDFCPKLESN